MPGEKLDVKQMVTLARMAERLDEEGADLEEIAKALDWPGAEETAQRHHAREALRVARFWPDETLTLAVRYRAPWHTLYEAARDHEGNPDTPIRTELRGYLDRYARWPAVAWWRRMAGRPPNHRLPGDNPEQSALFG